MSSSIPNIAIALRFFIHHADPIGCAFILQPEQYDAGVRQTGTMDQLAEVLVICHHDAVFINTNQPECACCE
jgi:hypothetical protein